MYSLDDLEKARANFEYWSELWCSESSRNKPNKYDLEARQAAKLLQEIEDNLKLNGLLAFTDEELAQESLNAKYPLAQSRDVVNFNGAQYQKRFYPKKRSKSGKTVKEWRSEWKKLDAGF